MSLTPARAASIDSEVRRLIDEAHSEAREILRIHRATLDALAAALIERETLDTPEVMEILGPLPKWPEANGNGKAAARKRTRSATPKA